MNPSHLCLGPILLQSAAAAAARIYALKWLRIRDQIVDAVLALVGDEVNTHAPKELQHLETGVSFIYCLFVSHQKNPV